MQMLSCKRRVKRGKIGQSLLVLPEQKSAAVLGGETPSVPIKQPEFDWNATDLSQEFTTLMRMCTSLLDDGPYSELSEKQKVATILN